jgi:hypothetical protein
MNYTIAQTVPEEDRENYLTEAEVSKMSRDFNNQLRNFSMQVEELTNLSRNLQKKYETEVSRNYNLRKSISQTKDLVKNTETEISSKSQRLSELEGIINSYSLSNPIHSNTNLSDLRIDLSSSPINDEVFKQLSELCKYLDGLEKTSMILETQQELIQNKIAENHRIQGQEVKCVNCFKMYRPDKNYSNSWRSPSKGVSNDFNRNQFIDHNSCIYHPGKIKYFSCKGCGRDPYYECCSKCDECSSGCRITHHTS